MSCLFPCACGKFILFTPFHFGGRSSCLTSLPPFISLRSVHFTHLSTARHKWLLHSSSQFHAIIPFRLSALILTQINPHTKSQLSSISFANQLFRFIHSPPMPIFNAYQWYIFPTAASPPQKKLSTFQAER